MVYFRVDANEIIASGHVSRCLSLADAFHAVGEEVTFLLSDEYATGAVGKHGHKVVVLDTDWRKLQDGLVETRVLLSENEARPLLLVDTYSVTQTYVDALSDVALVCYLGNKPGYLGRLHALINYSVEIDYASYQSWYGRVGTLLLLGPSYAPLRKEFLNRAFFQRDGVLHILLTTGGSDRDDATGTILSALAGTRILETCVVDVVVGPMFVHRASLRARYMDNSHVLIHENVRSMSDLMSCADLAISAGGTTLYELAAMDVPILTFALSSEQVSSAMSFDRIGAARYCGEMFCNQRACSKMVVKEALRLIGDAAGRMQLARRAHELVDGKGCERIVQILLASRSC